MNAPLSSLLRAWQRRDLMHRLGESALRGVCWSVAVAAVVPEGGWLVGGAVILVGEAIWSARTWRRQPTLADVVDAAGDTHGLLRAALSAEQDRAWGSPALVALVQQKAEAAAPALSAHAVRPLRLPRVPLGIGLLGMILLFLPDEQAAAEEGAALTGVGQFAPDIGKDPSRSNRDEPVLSSRLPGGAGEMAGGDAKAHAERGEGEAGATGAAGGGASEGEARQGAEGAGGSGEEGGRPAGNSSGAEGGFAEGENRQTGGGLGGQIADDDAAGLEDPDAMALKEDAERDGRPDGNLDPFGTEQDSIQSIDQERMEKHYTDLDNAVGAGTMAPQESSALTQDSEETATRTLGLALAGQGGINDAPGTVDLAAAPDADEIETTEAWIAARWRASAAGTLQTIDGGQSGGQSSQAWVELYDDYAALAEARMHREEIPPGRRNYVHAYFESIRSEP